MNYISDLSYLAIKKETSEGVAVIPDTFLPLESADIKTILNNEPNQRMFGVDFESVEASQGERKQEGQIKIWADPDTIGYIFDMFMKKGADSGNANDGYTREFTPEDPNTYTIDIPKGPYAQRFFGVKGDELNLIFEDAKLKAEGNVKTMGQFSASSLLEALTGAGMTSLKLNQEYDLEPTRGLVAGDVLVVGGVDITIVSLGADGFTVNFGSTSVTASIGDPVYLKKQDCSQSAIQKPFFFGDVLVGFGADASAAETAAGSKTTATPVHELKINFKNNLLNDNSSQERDVSKLLPQTKMIDVEIKQLFETVEQHMNWLELTKQGLCIIMRGRTINKATPTRNQLKITLHKAKIMEGEEPLEKGSYIFDQQTLKGLYDIGDGKAITVELINETATY